jgi:hypothetical protein
VFAVAGFSFWLLALDYLYRTLTMPFSILLIGAVVTGLVLVSAGIVANNRIVKRVPSNGVRTGAAPYTTVETPD